MDISKLKPFNLERALAGDPVVVQWMSSASGANEYYPARLVQLSPDGGTVRILFGEQGHMQITTRAIHNEETLFMAPKKRTVWVNLYPVTRGFWQGDTEEECDIFHVRLNPNLSDTDFRLGNRAYPIEIEE